MRLAIALLALQASAQITAPATVMVGEPVPLSGPAGVEFRIVSPAAAYAGRVMSNTLNIRTGPTTVSPVRTITYRGDRVLILREREDGWCEVIAPAGAAGFTSCEFLEQTPYGAHDLAMAPTEVEVEGLLNGASIGKTRIRVVPFEFDRKERVSQGIHYRERRFVLPEGEGPFTMQILEVDAGPQWRAVRARDRAIGRETTSSMANRNGAIAAVNGGYFVTTGTYAGASAGVYKLGGEIVSGGANRTALLRCEDQRVEFDIVNFSGSLTAAGNTTKVLGINRPRTADDLTVYTPLLGPNTLTDGSGVEAILGRNGVVNTVEDTVGSAAIPADGYVLSGTGTSAAWLRQNVAKGSTVKLDMRLDRETPGCDPLDVIGAGPRLVLDGKVAVSAEGFGHENTRNPRTAVAITGAGKLLFVTLDGRQSSSAGMRLDEFARELVALGAVKAMNLDGGGSTTMVVKEVIRNKPSDGSERPVSDALLLFSGSEQIPRATPARLLPR